MRLYTDKCFSPVGMGRIFVFLPLEKFGKGRKGIYITRPSRACLRWSWSKWIRTESGWGRHRILQFLPDLFGERVESLWKGLFKAEDLHGAEIFLQELPLR